MKIKITLPKSKWLRSKSQVKTHEDVEKEEHSSITGGISYSVSGFMLRSLINLDFLHPFFCHGKPRLTPDSGCHKQSHYEHSETRPAVA